METETVEARPRSPVSVEASARGITVVQDKPPAAGGADEGMMASELLLVSLLACQHSTFVKVAAKRRMEVRLRRLIGHAHFDGPDIARIEVHHHVEGGGARLADVETASRLTDRACTISRILKVPVEVHVHLEDA